MSAGSRSGLLLLVICGTGLAIWYALFPRTERDAPEPSPPPPEKVLAAAEQHPSLAFCSQPLPAGTLQLPETRLIEAARRASPRFWSITARMPYRPMGVFFSEALALVAMAELVGATHLIESGTADGQSTELLARYFAGTPLRITTIDRDTLYHLHEKTARRLAKWPAVRCLKGDSFDLVPKLLDGLPPGSRAVVFVDGPKGRLGFTLAQQALRHPAVGLVALHDTAAVWDEELHDELRANNETVMMTSLPPYRPIFAPLDSTHDEPEVLRSEYADHPHWPKKRIAPILTRGNGLWIGGVSKLRGDGDGASDIWSRKAEHDTRTHVAMSASLDQLQGLFACVVSLVEGALQPRALTVSIFVLGNTRARATHMLRCLRAAGLFKGARVRPDPHVSPPPGHLRSTSQVRLLTFDPARYALMRGSNARAATNYLRFYLPELLPQVDKVVWVDADGLVRGDVGRLAEGALVGEYARSPIAAVLRPRKTIEAATGLDAAQLRAIGLSRVSPSASVFNAGMLVMGLSQWRKDHVTQQVENLVRRLTRHHYKGFPGMSTEVDSQTPLVLLFQNASTKARPMIEGLPRLWNIEGLGWKGIRHLKPVPPADLCAGRYLHWSGKHKPWHPSRVGAHVQFWKRYVAPLHSCLTRTEMA